MPPGLKKGDSFADVVRQSRGPLLLSPFVLAELDYLLGRYVGDVVARYADLRIGLTDASIVVLAQRHGTRDVLTLDERHFRSLRTLDRRRFRLLPGDA